jgi:hypothetical protein
MRMITAMIIRMTMIMPMAHITTITIMPPMRRRPARRALPLL